MPTPDCPMSSSLSASTTNSTSIAPRYSDWEVSTPINTAVPRSPLSARNPSTVSAIGEPTSPGSAGGSDLVNGNDTQVATSIATANAATTQPGPPMAITPAATTGPTMMPALSIQPSAAFPAVSSSGVCTAAGSTTFMVGRVALNAGAARIANT